MHEMVDATRVALKLLDYTFLYEFKKHFCFFLKNPCRYLHSNFVIVRHNRIIIHIERNNKVLFENLFNDVEVIVNDHKVYCSVTYIGTLEQIAKMIIEFDDTMEMLNRSIVGDYIV